jgi:glycosyltransferase involved in cell wall biosynthesis
MLTSLSIVVPAYNEAPTIESVVLEALSVGPIVAHEIEVLACDDGSRDETYAVLRAVAGRDVRVRVLHRPTNRGIEASLRALYAAARHDYIFIISADRQWPMTSMVRLAETVEAGVDLAVGTRPNKREVYSPYRRVVSCCYAAAVRLLGSPVGDPGSIKLGRSECFRLPVVSKGAFSEAERLVRAARARYRIAARNVEFHPRRSGKARGAKPLVVAEAAADLLRTCSSLVLGRPRPRLTVPEADLVIG